MDDERVVEAIVSEFLLNSCRPRLQFSKPAIQAAALCAIEADKIVQPTTQKLTISHRQQEASLNSTLNRCCRISVTST